LEGNYHAVSNDEIACRAADFTDESHRLVAEDGTWIHEGTKHFVEVQIRSTDVGGGDLDDRVGRFFDLRIRNRIDRAT
jgi:hypothetical protein